ncbi:MAG TPA: MoxR family ATPase [Polyangiales bacterium]|jgi:MoxR-like ATPase|nr:MoxR family ATPase [Polyangiales bacterium]
MSTEAAHITELRDSSATAATEVAQRIIANVGKVLEGKREVVELAVAALLARGHLLIEDVPGVGKTTLARAMAASIGVEFRRLQFTSDLMPADVLGGSVYSQQKGEFSFRKGPIFTNVLLADEINRTTPKTQSALLEAMDERRVSLDGHTHVLEEPFFVLATQNPEEFFGTYPLPESQLDRFLMRVRIGYPPEEVERAVIARRRKHDPVSDLVAVVDRRDLVSAQASVDRVRVSDEVVEYLHGLVLATRATPLLSIGASTRAAIALERAVRAHALTGGRHYATPDDVKTVAVAVLAHRVRPSGSRDGGAAHVDGERIIRDLLSSLPVPV